MVRVVDLPKAVLAGVAGACVMEVLLHGMTLLGLPSADLVVELSSTVFRRLHWLALAGAGAVHVAIGIGWAIFYGYFFWARWKLPPAIQGLIFAGIPAILAIFVVYPQLELMRLGAPLTPIDISSFYAPLSASVIATLLIAHAAFGLTMGAIYTKPVGYPVGSKVARPTPRRPSGRNQKSDRQACAFMFATGIECSYPTIEHGRWRRDEMQSTRHYEYWQHDFELAREIGISHIRYGPPLHLMFRGPGDYDWSYADPQMSELRDCGPEPIIDICHFGVPAWLGNLQNKEIAPMLAEYAGAFAERYPWVRFYTPVNEMYVCARMSTIQGLWNEQLVHDEGAFVNAAFNLAHASIRMSDEILKRRPDAIFINSESSEFYQPCCPDEAVQRKAAFENERRFLPLDLIYAHKISDGMREYLHEHHVEDSQLDQFARRKVPERSILGVDYYEWNERLIDRNGQPLALGELFGWYVIADQYWRRYKRPMMHTETNKMDADGAPRWLWRQWHNVQLLAKAGVPLVGFTWYSLTDQIDWSIALSEPLGIVYPVGLFDLNREARTVGLAYKHLIDLYQDLPQYRECEALKRMMG